MDFNTCLNTSPLSPEELDNSSDLKSSDSISLAFDMMDLYQYFNPIIFRGCCGTDITHMEEITKILKLLDTLRKTNNFLILTDCLMSLISLAFSISNPPIYVIIVDVPINTAYLGFQLI